MVRLRPDVSICLVWEHAFAPEVSVCLFCAPGDMSPSTRNTLAFIPFLGENTPAITRCGWRTTIDLELLSRVSHRRRCMKRLITCNMSLLKSLRLDYEDIYLVPTWSPRPKNMGKPWQTFMCVHSPTTPPTRPHHRLHSHRRRALRRGGRRARRLLESSVASPAVLLVGIAVVSVALAFSIASASACRALLTRPAPRASSPLPRRRMLPLPGPISRPIRSHDAFCREAQPG